MSNANRDPQPQKPGRPSSTGDLPLRWALIIAVAVGFGLLVGKAAGLVSGITLGLVLMGLLHTILPKD